jgi:hypothetical protein
VVFAKMVEVLKDRPAEVIIGGARGVDTAAFIACAKVKHADNDLHGFRLTVILPGSLGEAPKEFQEALRSSQLIVNGEGRYAVGLVELGMDVSHPQSFHVRNSVMLGRAGWSATCAVLLAFPGIKVSGGGTDNAIDTAMRQGMAIVKQPVRVA